MDIILDIRRRYQIDTELLFDSLDVVEQLQQALELLADQLYSTDTHFVMEFVQNAEDNAYPDSPDVFPTLRIVVNDVSMTLSCNEVGFTEKNVRAICKIGGSTKKNNPGFIGEKGIGFKSVFKVADVVHVASGPYTFKFDRSRRLGMIAPIWDPSLAATHGWTKFYLEFSPPQHGSMTSGMAISEKLDEIKPSLLLFLNKLRIIEIDVRIGGSRLVKIERRNLDLNFVQLVRVVNRKVVSKDTYFIIKRFTDMSDVNDCKRKGVKQTETVLAFPVNNTRCTQISPQDVHAFLPMRSFGFNFVIHGDFLTSSSREDVLHDSLWNLYIRDSVVDTFITAIHAFQKQPTLRDFWIRYLPTGIVDAFFRVVERDLFKKLQTMLVVRDNNGVLRRPSQILSIPSDLRYKERPLIPAEHMSFYYLSDDYDTSVDGPLLRRLGVREMTSNDLLSGLEGMGPEAMEACDNGWHEAVCIKLSRLSTRNPSLLNLRLLPLDDGSWALARCANEFVFESDISGIPDHISFRRIHWRISASTTPQRHTLFCALGVRQADPAFVAEKILDYEGCHLPLQSHLANARFFFTHRRSQLPSPAKRLKLVDESEKADASEKLYIDLPRDEGRLRRALPPSARFIHTTYMRQYQLKMRDEWICWLHNSLQLNTAPRLVNNSLSPEFAEMSRRLSLCEFLDVLKYFWSRWPSRSSFRWHKELGYIPAELDGNFDCTINSTFLKRGMMARYSGLPFLPVTNPESEEWDFLARLGVTINANTTFFVKLLIHYQTQALNDEKAVISIYKQLDARFCEDALHIRDAFKLHPLVFLKSNAKSATLKHAESWMHLSEVYWDGPSSMASRIALRSLYPDLREFFQENLGVQNAPPSILVDELKYLAREWSDQTISSASHRRAADLLIDLSTIVKDARMDSAGVLSLIREHAIFPAHCSLKGLRLRKLVDIYIPDRSGYYASIFRGKVPLLDFPDFSRSYNLSKIGHLLLVADSEGLAHHLHHSVDHQVMPFGRREVVEQLTATYASRYKFIERIVYNNSEPSKQQREALSKLQEMSIYTVDSISSTLSLTGIAPISTETELLHLSEEKHTITVLISRKAYTRADAVNRVHLDICRRLGGILRCDFNKLLICVMMDAGAVDDYLQAQEIDDIDVYPTQDDAWMTPSTVRAASFAKSPGLSTLPLRNNDLCDKPQEVLIGRDGPQKSFSMQELQSEIDSILDSLAGLSVSSIRVFGSNHQPSSHSPHAPHFISSDTLQTAITDEQGAADMANTQIRLPNEVLLTAVEPKSVNASESSSSISRPAPLPFVGGLSLLSSVMISSEQPSAYQRMNGVLGERYVYELLSRIIGPTFGPDNWTSELRGLNPGFDGFEGRGLADFKFEDRDGILTAQLFINEPELLKEWEGRYPMYHIEVKATSSGSHEPFFWSRRQFETALRCTRCRKGDDLPQDVYVLIRVWSIRKPTTSSYAIYVDPIRCILDNSLKVVSDKLEMMTGN